ncbi:MAG: ribonuclease III [Candidatus Latescibacterota bacterium]|nr:MAG: ribonuclease III [Candidatus Latescibacterota bacterium]
MSNLMVLAKLDFLRKLRERILGPSRAPSEADSVADLENVLGYRFQDRSLLVRALVHRSYPLRETQELDRETSNERMEFLGDAVLSLVVNDYLYDSYPRKWEGELTKMKSVIVSKSILSHYARQHGLGAFILMSENAQKAGVDETESVLADTLEAIFGAVFLDGGFDAARECVRRLLLADINDIFYSEKNINYKSLLQEYIQALHKVPPRYRVSSTKGPEHEKEFAVEVSVRGNVLGTGVGKTKKLAEQEAAKSAYQKLLNTDGIVDPP